MGQGPYELSEETDDEKTVVNPTWIRPQNDVCAEEFGMKLTREDLYCLKPGKCLKGEVIHYYMQLIIRRSDMDVNLPTDFLAAYSVKTNDEEAEPSNWIGFCAKNIPKQDNGYDCGAFVCRFADRISRGAPIDFLQGDMEGMRKKMVSKILGGELS
uniref:Ubiquitin-like protease family profile domain-containing protein n=1 Tax=Ditylenchus dipsaci TaxID=166011 RepID=A0A915EEA6_9BILA